MDETTVSGRVQGLVLRLNAGDQAARDELLNVTRDRLHVLAHRMFSRFPKLRVLEETDDLVQNAAIRIWKAMEDIQPSNAREYFGLSTTQLRRELLDMTRHHFGRKGERDLPRQPPEHASSRTFEPVKVAIWTEFHETVEQLPEAEREVAGLIWYQELSQPEIAGLLGVAVSTVKRRWRDARLKLASSLGGSLPDA